MKKLIILLFTTFIYCGIGKAQQQRFIEVVAEETMDVSPNEVTIEFRLKEKKVYEETNYQHNETHEYELVEEAVEEVEEETVESYTAKRKQKYKPRKPIIITIAEQEKTIKSYLKEKGIHENNLSLSIENRDYYRSTTKQGYTLKIDKIKLLPEVIHTLDSMGASRVRLSSIKNTKTSEYKREMALKALEKAKNQAKKMLAIYNESLGSVISISEDFGTPSNNDNAFYDLIVAELMRKNKTNPLSMSVTYQVKVKFAIKN